MDKKLKKYIEQYEEIDNCLSYKLMQVPTQPTYIENNILQNELNSYFKNRLTTGTLPFNIMRKILNKIFSLRTGLTVKTYALFTELKN